MDETKFWAKVAMIPFHECWEWVGRKNPKGYGFCYARWGSHREQLAHRASWIIHYGNIPAGKHILHKCDNPGCVRPEHLYAGTNAENVRDKMIRGRTGKEKRAGERHHATKFTADDVRSIRSSTATHTALAKQYGVTIQCISQIRKGKNWRYL